MIYLEEKNELPGEYSTVKVERKGFYDPVAVSYTHLDVYKRQAAHDAYKLAAGFPSLRAGALNNQGFCAFIHMDFDKAEDLFLRVYEESNNELECLIACLLYTSRCV